METFLNICSNKEDVCKECCPHIVSEMRVPKCYLPLTADSDTGAEVTLDCGVMPDTEWHKVLVTAIRKQTGCTHEQAFAALGEVCEIVQRIHLDAFARGMEEGKKA
jgi:hypothetical protein